MTLREYRVSTGMTQEQLADLADCSTHTIQRYEAGRVPDDAMKRRLFEISGGLVAPNDHYPYVAAIPAAVPHLEQHA